MLNNAFTLASLVPSLIVLVVYFSKQRIKNYDNRLYSAILITNFVELILAVLTYITIMFNELMPIVNEIVSRTLILSMFTWITLFTIYIYLISEDSNVLEQIKNKKKLFIILIIIFYVLAAINVFSLPLYYYKSTHVAYSYGPAANIIYALDGLFVIFWVICLLRNLNSIKEKKYLPLFILILIGSGAILIQKLYPAVLLMSAALSYVTQLMYFTIENPDVKMLEKVEIARDQADKANRAKSDFLSSMSHEIRTPLNAIVGLSEDIGSYKNEVPEAVSEDAEDIINASQTLLEIVGNILDINKIESNKLEIVELVYQPKIAIEQIAKIDSVRIGDKPIDFKIHIAEDLPYELIGDKVHIKTIVNNLITNAIKYTENGEINVNVRCINKGDLCNLIISVQDTGRGIKAENITKLFTKFERLDIEKNTTTEGTGLGLAITKRLVEMMNGTINVQSQYGKGSLFVVNIPQKIKSLSAPLSGSEIAEEVIIDIDNYDHKKILIVDDNTLNIKVARRALQDFNFDIEDVLSGKECLEKVASGIKYDLILMDIMMPEMSGETTFRKLKEIDGFKTPVIALTADAVAGAEEHYKKEGFADYIAKPFKRDQIKEKLDLIFDNKSPINWDKVPVHIIGDNK